MGRTILFNFTCNPIQRWHRDTTSFLFYIRTLADFRAGKTPSVKVLVGNTGQGSDGHSSGSSDHEYKVDIDFPPLIPLKQLYASVDRATKREGATGAVKPPYCMRTRQSIPVLSCPHLQYPLILVLPLLSSFIFSTLR